jgi:hypothetical protein
MYKENIMEIKDKDFEDLIEYLKHDSWRCKIYQVCHCGLNNITDEIGIARVPYGEKTYDDDIPH